jgi:hypothetical protein
MRTEFFVASLATTEGERLVIFKLRSRDRDRRCYVGPSPFDAWSREIVLRPGDDCVALTRRWDPLGANSGAGDGLRTRDFLSHSQALYP